MLRERQVLLSVPLGHGSTQRAFPFCFSIWLCFPRKAVILSCKKIGKLSAAYFISDTVLSRSQQCHTFPLPQPDRAPPVARQELLLLKLKRNNFQVPSTLFTQGQICTICTKSSKPLSIQKPVLKG